MSMYIYVCFILFLSEVFCKYHPADLMMDPTNCARYYNCSDPSIKEGLGVKYLHECRYPRLFKDVQTGCVLFLNVTCAERYEPKAPCKYNISALRNTRKCIYFVMTTPSV